MTSPAQLKYLDAIGIPVWVSRDLVGKKSDIVSVVENTLVNETENFSQLNDTSPVVQGVLEKTNTAAVDDKPQVSIRNEVTNTDNKSSVNDTKNQDIAPTPPINSTLNLYKQTANHSIYASGSNQADWMIIGYSPEPFTGIEQEPFGGEAGVLLDNMLKAVNIEHPRHHAYMINILDINTSDAREAKNIQSNNELKLALLKLIEENKPKVLLLVGQNAAQVLLDSSDPLIILRSKTHSVSRLEIPAVVTYYPSYLLSKPSDKRKAWEDLKQAMQLLNTVKQSSD